MPTSLSENSGDSEIEKSKKLYGQNPAEISDKLVIKGSIKKPMPLNRLGMVLKKAGYTQKCLGGKVRGWLVRELDADEINANRRINAKP